MAAPASPLPSTERLLWMYERMGARPRARGAASRPSSSAACRSGAVHFYTGQEAVAVGVCAALAPATTGSPRPTAATATASPRASTCSAMMAELYGKVDRHQPRQGRLDAHHRRVEGHARRQRHRRRGRRPRVGAAALGAKVRGTRPGRASRFFGEGAASMGAVHEAMNLAAIWRPAASSSSARTTATPQATPVEYALAVRPRRRPRRGLPHAGRHRRRPGRAGGLRRATDAAARAPRRAGRPRASSSA